MAGAEWSQLWLSRATRHPAPSGQSETSLGGGAVIPPSSTPRLGSILHKGQLGGKAGNEDLGLEGPGLKPASQWLL